MSRSKSSSQKPLSWKPKRYTHAGLERYCSPACGAHCMRALYLIAQANATKLAMRLGPKWRPYVWENGAWHFRAVLPLPDGNRAEVYQHDPRRFWFSLIIDGQQYQAQEPTPARVRDAMRKIMLAHANKLVAVGAALTPFAPKRRWGPRLVGPTPPLMGSPDSPLAPVCDKPKAR